MMILNINRVYEQELLTKKRNAAVDVVGRRGQESFGCFTVSAFLFCHRRCSFSSSFLPSSAVSLIFVPRSSFLVSASSLPSSFFLLPPSSFLFFSAVSLFFRFLPFSSASSYSSVFSFWFSKTPLYELFRVHRVCG